jgi:phosphoadenosine phosphosulfate reductase
MASDERVEIAIQRIKMFEPKEGYYVAFSGGKDSQVILDLVERSGVKFDAHMNLTTVDPPEVLQFVREHYADRVTMERPETSMFKLIVRKQMPPTRRVRYCCEYLKERGGRARLVMTGVRWAESTRRKQRRMTESCFRDGKKTFLHPVIDWTDDDVWSYLRERKIPHCSLYDEGRHRIGCIMCPLARRMKEDAARFPKFAAMYKRACLAGYAAGVKKGRKYTWASGEEMHEWWINNGETPKQKVDPDVPELFPLDN